ncbi:MAG: CaiB/BaiF CoA-transferase family protein, partial [Gammaproteobacteria bacterium]|nr:CaiB/BaiF CoA-transferase family protein [Gammaproteobacteria bacterium]
GAYIHRLKTGVGQRIDTSLFEAGIVHTYWQSAIAFATGVSPVPMGSAHPLNAPYQAFETADGWITIGAANQANWMKLLDALEAPHIGEDPRFSENPGRMENLSALVSVLAPIFKTRTSADWLNRLERAGVPAGPVLDITAMHRDPQTLARQMVLKVRHSKLGETETLGHPVKYSLTPVRIERGAPMFGEHSREILSEHGYDEKTIDALIAAGAVVAA